MPNTEDGIVPRNLLPCKNKLSRTVYDPKYEGILPDKLLSDRYKNCILLFHDPKDAGKRPVNALLNTEKKYNLFKVEYESGTLP